VPTGPDQIDLSSRPYTKWLEPIVLIAVGLESLPNVDSLLKSEPELGSCIKHASQSVRKIRIYGSTLMNKIINSVTRYAEPSCKLRLG
jgi:hypothetical protein